ncbi:MAG TPA: TonB family protein [Candidatus Acidoferrales bacterium]|nr:TonB family protein [Candidatus Acidoferrales bacterium]
MSQPSEIRTLQPHASRRRETSCEIRRIAFALGLGGLLALVPASHSATPNWGADSGARRVVSEQNGTLTIRDGDRVRVTLEMGDVHVRTQSTGSVQYRLRVEAPAGAKDSQPSVTLFHLTARSGSDGAVVIGRAEKGRSSERFWVTLELDIPRASPLEISTQGGSVDVGDIDGRLACDTAGGKIRVGRVGASARLQTAGGDVVVQDVAGDLTATTGGGHILAGAVHGSATLHSEGGHIRVARVDGVARIETGGGNIFLDHAGARLIATTAGGRIMVGEASGSLQARNGSGGIRVWKVAGPAHIQTDAGSIFLAGVTSPVSASTAAGGITALFETAAPPAPSMPPNPPRPSDAPRLPDAPRVVRAGTLGEFECNGGDIVIFLPKELSMTLDAAIEGGENYRIVVDPALMLSLKTNGLLSGKTFRAEGMMGGGGPLLRLRANSGNILLRPVAAPEAMVAPAVPANPAIAPLRPIRPAPPAQDSMEAAVANLEISLAEMQSELEIRQDKLESFASAQELQARYLARRAAELERRAAKDWAVTATTGDAARVEYNWSSEQLSEMEGLREKLTAWLTDRVIISSAQMRPRLVRRVDPMYPPKAREAGLEGAVLLRVAVSRDGSIEEVTALSGDPLLAAAAVDAVRQWRYRPTLLNGRPVPVLTVLTITFHRP